MTKYAVIVDAYSTGAMLPGEFAKYGMKCLHVQSSGNITADFLASFKASDFVQGFVVNSHGALDAIVDGLRKYDVTCVVAGTETGVEMAEQLAALLDVPGNEPSTSRVRRDKFKMHEQLRAAGLSALPQANCTTVQQALDWAQQHGKWPVVVKPTASAGADGVTFCDDLDQVKTAASAILGQRNKLGELNEAIVIQEKLVGQQYIVNAVSINGEHYISEIWRDDKIAVENASLICDREVLLEPDSAISLSLQQYVKACLDALGIKEGPSHSELFKTSDGQLVLIETAARMQGTIDHKAVVEATGHSHVTLTALRYADPGAFARLVGSTYQRRTNLHCVTLCSTHAGIVVDNHCPDKIGKLASFRSLIHTPRPGEAVARTIDLFTNPGIVYLANADESHLEREYRQIRSWESAGELFTLRAS